MSKLIVDVCRIEEISPIEGAERIELVRIKNWWCVAGKGHYKVGDKAVYVPPESLVPESLADRWGIAKYCSQPAKDAAGNRAAGLRVRACRFMGTPSFGTIQDPDDPSWSIGTDVSEYYGITKYEPPVKSSDGDAAPSVIQFHAYTSIENFGNYPNVFNEGEEVVITEKIHGTNWRGGLVCSDYDSTWEWMAGSHSIRRKEFDEKGRRSRYWLPFSTEEDNCPLRDMLTSIRHEKEAKQSVIAFGEIFGPGVQDMTYGQKGLAFRLFDISVDGTYLDYDEFVTYLTAYQIQMVPLLYRGPFSPQKVYELVDGPTTICDQSEIVTKFKGREGVVFKPIRERFDPTLKGRTVLKFISADYLSRKGGTEDH